MDPELPRKMDYPLVICYSWQFIFDLPIKNGDFPVRYVNLPEGTVLVKGLWGYSNPQAMDQLQEDLKIAWRSLNLWLLNLFYRY